jgi:hypothetical protein
MDCIACTRYMLACASCGTDDCPSPLCRACAVTDAQAHVDRVPVAAGVRRGTIVVLGDEDDDASDVAAADGGSADEQDGAGRVVDDLVRHPAE